MTNDGGRSDFCDKIPVSRETLAKLDTYASMLKKWSPKINLVAKSTLSDIWRRHFLDSAQVFQHALPKQGLWVDIGSGGGFPGAIIAILTTGQALAPRFVFVESDHRKSVFLQEVIRNLDLHANVLSRRVEDIAPLGADVLTARALAPLPKLLGYANRHLAPNGQALFMKGASFRRELDEALETWTFRSDEYTSITDDAATILSIGDIKRV